MATIQVSEASLSLIEERLRTGSYGTVDDVVQAGLHSLRHDEEELRRLIQEGDDDIKAGRFTTFERSGDLKKHILDLVKERQDARTAPEHVQASVHRPGSNL